MIAPKICPHFSLVQQTAETSQISPVTFKFQQGWKTLLSLYESLYQNKMQIESCRKNSTEMLAGVQRHEQEMQKHMRANDLAFVFKDLTPSQFAVAAKNMKRILKDLQTIRDVKL
jgi:hypothetical protein